MAAPPSTESVTAAVNAWLWVPPEAEVIDTPDLLLINWPAHFEWAPSLMRFTPQGDIAATFAQATDAARGWGYRSLIAWVKLNAPDGFEDLLKSRGTLDEVVDVFALDLDRWQPQPPTTSESASQGSETPGVRWVQDVADMRDYHRINAAAFGQGRMPDRATLSRESAEAASDYLTGKGGIALGYLTGPAAPAEAVGIGVLTLVDHVARLSGGGVIPQARKRGVYSALVTARLAYAVEHGATMAVVKGRVETSGPILRRLGFEVFGQERSYVVRL